MNFTRLNQRLKRMRYVRDKHIVQEAVLSQMNFEELGKKYGLSRAGIGQVLRKFGIKVPLIKGTPKYENWKKRDSDSNAGKPKPWKKSQK